MSSIFETTIRRNIPWTRTLVVDIDGDPVDFTGYSCIARIGPVVLTNGAGVELGDDGTIVLSLTGPETDLMIRSRANITIDLISADNVALEPRIEGRAVVEE